VQSEIRPLRFDRQEHVFNLVQGTAVEDAARKTGDAIKDAVR
jgi:hypothetical protein